MAEVIHPHFHELVAELPFYQEIQHDPELVELYGPESLRALEIPVDGDPERLIFSRWISAELLAQIVDPLHYLQTVPSGSIAAWDEWNHGQDPNGEGLLWEDDKKQIFGEGYVRFPRPAGRRFVHENPPHEKYLSYVDLFYLDIYRWLGEGAVVGLTSGVYDILHGGHVQFLEQIYAYLYQEAHQKKAKGIASVVLVDDNRSAAMHGKKPQRPILPHPMRVGTINNMERVTFTSYHPYEALATMQVPPQRRQENRFIVVMPLEPFGITEVTQSQLEILKGLIAYQKHEGHSLPEYVRLHENLYYFYSEEDPHADMRELWASAINANPVGLPQYVSMHTTDLIRHFSISQPQWTRDMREWPVEPRWATQRHRWYEQFYKELEALGRT